MLKECVLSLPPERYSTRAQARFLQKNARKRNHSLLQNSSSSSGSGVAQFRRVVDPRERTGGSKPDVLLVCVSFIVLFFLFNSPKISPIYLGFGFGFCDPKLFLSGFFLL